MAELEPAADERVGESGDDWGAKERQKEGRRVFIQTLKCHQEREGFGMVGCGLEPGYQGETEGREISACAREDHPGTAALASLVY